MLLYRPSGSEISVIVVSKVPGKGPIHLQTLLMPVKRCSEGGQGAPFVTEARPAGGQRPAGTLSLTSADDDSSDCNPSETALANT